MILNVKGSYVYLVLVNIGAIVHFFLTGQSKMVVCILNKTFLLQFKVFFVLFILLLDDTKSKSSKGGLFFNFLIVAVHYTYQINLCIFSIVDCTHIHHIVHYKINHILLFLLLAYM